MARQKSRTSHASNGVALIERKETKFVTFGETLVQHNADYLGPYDPEGSYTRHVAGAESNVAIDLRKLMPDEVRAVWVSRLGADADGGSIASELTGRIEVHAPQVAGEKTGIQLLNHLGGGEVIRRYRRAGSAASRLTAEEVLPHLEGADLLHVTGITPALSDTCLETTLSVMSAAQRTGVPVSMDVNYREALWSPAEARAVCDRMREHATLFKVGHDEADTIWGGDLTASEHARRFVGGTTQLAIVTTGDSGAVAFDGNQLVEHSGFSVEVVDPVGAGDAFVAGALAGIFQQGSMLEFLALPADERANVLHTSLELGNACGALICTRHGDTEAMPDMAQVREFISAR